MYYNVNKCDSSKCIMYNSKIEPPHMCRTTPATLNSNAIIRKQMKNV